MEIHLTSIFHSVHGNFMAKVIFMCTMSSRTGFYLQKVNLLEIHLWWENAHIVLCRFENICMKIFCKLDGNIAAGSIISVALHKCLSDTVNHFYPLTSACLLDSPESPDWSPLGVTRERSRSAKEINRQT